MSELEHAMSFRDLVVHQKARKVAQMIFELSKSFPKDELYSLTDQIRRAARSTGAQIAEAWGKGRFERHFISKLTEDRYRIRLWLSNGGPGESVARTSFRNWTNAQLDDQ